MAVQEVASRVTVVLYGKNSGGPVVSPRNDVLNLESVLQARCAEDFRSKNVACRFVTLYGSKLWHATVGDVATIEVTYGMLRKATTEDKRISGILLIKLTHIFNALKCSVVEFFKNSDIFQSLAELPNGIHKSRSFVYLEQPN